MEVILENENIKSSNIVWHHTKLDKKTRYEKLQYKPCILWFTGLSGSGKSTLASHLEHALFQKGIHCYVLDGDNIRHGLNKNLGFSPEDRTENIRRIGEVAKLFIDAGIIVLTAFISPYQADRDQVRKLVEPGEFIEIFLDCSVEVCEQRDTKGLYKKARAGIIPEFTGISAPYEKPLVPEITLSTSTLSIERCAQDVVLYLKNRVLYQP